MRKLTKILTGVATAAAALALAVPAAHADPISKAGKAITPAEYDIVGVGSDSIQYVMDQLSYDYDYGTNRVHNSTHPYIYSWDAVKPGTASTTSDNITLKSGCASIVRKTVDGSSAGIKYLALNTRTSDKKYYCADFARSSRARTSTDPSTVLFVPLAKDAVTYATTKTTDAPANLTITQLAGIYTCKYTNWKQVGGKSAAIKAYIPQSGSGTRAFFLSAIGVSTLGSCVIDSTTNPLQENEGTDARLNSPQAVVPYSVGSWLAQKYHSAACGKTPTASQNKFGCNSDGVLYLNKINGTVPFINSGTAKSPNYVTNPNFTAAMIRTLYNVVRLNKSATYHMDPREATFFAPNGFFCSNATAKAAIKAYGFMVTGLCGHGS